MARNDGRKTAAAGIARPGAAVKPARFYCVLAAVGGVMMYFAATSEDPSKFIPSLLGMGGFKLTLYALYCLYDGFRRKNKKGKN